MQKVTLLPSLPAGLARIQKDIERLAQIAIRLSGRADDDAQLPVGASKLGGAPDLPPGTAWPTWKNTSMSFVAQVQLSDVRPFDAEHRLPATGLLLFFYDAQQQTYGADPADRGGWQVRYVVGAQPQLRRAAPPADLPAASRFRPCALTFSRAATLPQRPEVLLPQLDWTSAERQLYDDFVMTLLGSTDPAAPRHQLLGHPDTLQDDMHLQCALAANGIGDINDPRAAALAKTAPDWQLLLQIDSDEQAGMRWGSAGMLYYWLERAALHRPEMSNSWLVLQSE
jgi:uncharacterized protein YwqG